MKTDVGHPALNEAVTARVVPAQSPSDLREALAEATAARERILRQQTTETIARALAQAATTLRTETFAPGTRALADLARRCDLDPHMLARGLDHCLGALSESALLAMVAAEAQSVDALDHPVGRPDGSFARLLGPPLVLHRLAGNVPGLAVAPVAACLLARSVCVVRESSRQPPLTAALRASLQALVPDLATMLVCLRWNASDRTMDLALDAIVDRAELYGSDATVAELARLYGTARIVERADRLSIGILPRRERATAWAEGFAEDICLYEGKGCLTPHVLLVEGDPTQARVAAGELHGALRALSARWPRQRQSLELEAHRRAFLDEAEVSALAHDDETVLRGEGDAWCVSVSPRARLAPGPGLRCVRVLPVVDQDEMLRRLARSEVPLAGAGVGASPGSAGFTAIASALERCGATWVCPAGRMQAPPLAWRQDGRRRLGDLLAWREQAG